MSLSSRIPGFYKHSVEDRLRMLLDRGVLTAEDYDTLLTGRNVVEPEEADRLIENVIGTQSLPLGLGLNFLVNEREYIVPMAVEEPSIVAAVSSAAKTARAGGGFRCRSMDPMLIGQIQVVGVEMVPGLKETVLEHKEQILDLANSLHPNMVARGGGARDLELHVHPATSTRPEMFIVHLVVDTRDAMGANLVNSMCEEVAPLIEQLTGGQVFLRILSNLTDRAMVVAEATIPLEQLASNGYSGSEVRDGIILANQFAEVDPHRAATHNKGIMNGIDAVALATGNDWRAIEAGAHAYAGMKGPYRSLTRWWRTEAGDLAGALEIPLKVGTVGGQMASNPTYGIAHRLLGSPGARELAEVMAAVGLAQNFGALRALSTDGIQRGHMALHARSVAVAAGTPVAYFERVVDRLVQDGNVKIWRAKEIVDEIKSGAGSQDPADDNAPATAGRGAGNGKIILLGEHAVVYGRHALAAPVDMAMRAIVDERPGAGGIEILIPQWNVSETMEIGADPRNSLEESLQLILRELDLEQRPMSIHLRSAIPRAMGLGGSAALAVAVIRAIDARFTLGLDDEQVNNLAYLAEQHAHGRASGIDNSVATYGRPILFKRGEPPVIREVTVGRPTPVVVGLSRHEGLTAAMVGRVAQARESTPNAYERLFDEIDVLTLQAAEELEAGNLENLGRCMNLCHGLLNALQVSTHQLEELVEIARNHGALGAKLTGAGGGGAIIALAPENPERIVQAMRAKRYRAFITHLGQPESDLQGSVA
ncbi:MAG: hydroxymethylglutaryl-CoA reductase, degradative [Planctomycetota bacterium]|nr:hydroxymethylglutaryl-CoA reductase, degradative [Planctomycetota bacterium]